MPNQSQEVVALIGFGSIGVSFAALHLRHTTATLRVYDPRPDLHDHVRSSLSVYLDSTFSIDELLSDSGRLRLCDSLEEACEGSTIVQEQGPEDVNVKCRTWSRVLKVVEPSTHLWSSTSGIPASLQAKDPEIKSRLLVVHPFNPPHIMPLIEIVPSPDTLESEVDFTKTYFETLGSGHRPVVIRKEVPGFVANRLAFILLREACSLVASGTVTVSDLDTIIESSLGPRWCVTGPFKSYNYGGGIGGLPAFLKNLTTSIENVWQTSGHVSMRGTEFEPKDRSGSEDTKVGKAGDEGDWTKDIVRQTIEAYGYPNLAALAKRDAALRSVLDSRDSC